MPSFVREIEYKQITFVGIGILGFPKTEIERKPQRNFQIDFIKIMLKNK